MPKISPQKALRLLAGLNLLRVSETTRQAITQFLLANAQAGQVNELQAQLQTLNQERQASIAATARLMRATNERTLSNARQLLANIPDELFESAANEAGLDD